MQTTSTTTRIRCFAHFHCKSIIIPSRRLILKSSSFGFTYVYSLRHKNNYEIWILHVHKTSLHVYIHKNTHTVEDRKMQKPKTTTEKKTVKNAVSSDINFSVIFGSIRPKMSSDIREAWRSWHVGPCRGELWNVVPRQQSLRLENVINHKRK